MKILYKTTFILVMFLSYHSGIAQELYVGAGAEFYLKKDLDFTSGTIVTVDTNGQFSVEAGSLWGSALEYVNGNVFAYGTGITKLPVGNNGKYAPVTADHTGDVSASYFNAAPNSGTNGTDVNAVSDEEYWELTGNAIITLPWDSSSDITNLVNSNGGVLNSVAIVGYDSGTWNLVSATETNTVTGDLLNGTVTSDPGNEVTLDNFAQFTFGIDNQAVLGIDDLFLSNQITLLSNPIKQSDNINFSFQNSLDELEVILYDVTGKKLRYYEEIVTFNGIGSLQRPNVKSGIYFLRFLQQGKQGVKKIIIE